MPETDVEPQPGPRSKSGKPTRRGPMDEMRQLVRILVKASTSLPSAGPCTDRRPVPRPVAAKAWRQSRIPTRTEAALGCTQRRTRRGMLQHALT